MVDLFAPFFHRYKLLLITKIELRPQSGYDGRDRCLVFYPVLVASTLLLAHYYFSIT
jgi:hypothetical protein